MTIDPNKSHAFLSYTRSDDDDYLKGGISWLREELEKSVSARTGYPFQIFQDVEGIHPGERWARKLDQALKGAQIFIPVLTPSFFRSSFCRREAQAFLDYEISKDREGLILPLYLVKAPLLENEELLEADEIAQALLDRQHDDWRSVAGKLRHKDTRWEVADRVDRLAEVIADVVEDYPLEDVGSQEHGENIIFSSTTDSISTVSPEVRVQNKDASDFAEATTASPLEEETVDRSRDSAARFEKNEGLAKEREDFGTSAFARNSKVSRSQSIKQQNEVFRATLPANDGKSQNSSPSGISIRQPAIVLASLVVGVGVGWWVTSYDGVQTQQMQNQNLLTRSVSQVNKPSFATVRDCEVVCPELLAIEAGTFMMGTPKEVEGHSQQERPQHQVTIAEPFALCQTEVTFAQWDACWRAGECKRNPGDKGWGRGDRPVINVSWEDTQQYLAWLSKKTGSEYRLPSEAEWEYAARAGTVSRFSFGESISTDQANYNGRYRLNPESKGRYVGETLPVGSLEPNKFGLYDMHGNVWEWVEDRYHSRYFGAPSDGSSWNAGESSLRVLRGGSWDDREKVLCSACRNAAPPASRGDDIGFRCAKTL